jgi:hypothetical protein
MMPYDSEASRLQGEISQLEKEIGAMGKAISYVEFINPTPKPTVDILKGIVARLQTDLEYKEMKLSIHRQRTKESGVKY